MVKVPAWCVPAKTRFRVAPIWGMAWLLWLGPFGVEHCAASRVEVEPAVQLKATCKNSCPTIPATMARPAHAPKQLTQHEHKLSIVMTFITYSTTHRFSNIHYSLIVSSVFLGIVWKVLTSKSQDDTVDCWPSTVDLLQDSTKKHTHKSSQDCLAGHIWFRLGSHVGHRFFHLLSVG